MTADVQISWIFLFPRRSDAAAAPASLPPAVPGCLRRVRDPALRTRRERRAMFLSAWATSASAAFSFLVRGAARSGAAEAGLRHSALSPAGGAPVPQLSRSICVWRSAGGGSVACKAEIFSAVSRSAASVFLKPAINGREFFVATFDSGFCFVTAFHQRTFFLLRAWPERPLCSLRVLLPLGVDVLERFFDLRDPDRDLLFVPARVFQGHDFVAHFRKLCSLRCAFPAQGDLGFLQETLLRASGPCASVAGALSASAPGDPS